MRFKETDREGARLFLKEPNKCPCVCLYLNAESDYGGMNILHSFRFCKKYGKNLRSRFEKRITREDREFTEWTSEHVFRCEECLESEEIEV